MWEIWLGAFQSIFAVLSILYGILRKKPEVMEKEKEYSAD